MEIRQILLRADTAANWISVNPVLGSGEVGLELDTARLKIGDGSSAWSALAYGRVDLSVSRTASAVTVGATGDDAVLLAASSTNAGVMSAADKVKLDGITTMGDVISTADTTFTGQNTFLNASGQVFGTAVATEDGLIIKGREGGSSGYRVTLRPAALSGNRELQVPDRDGVLITSDDVGTVSAAMVAAAVLDDGSY